MKVTQREIKSWVALSYAEDITHATFEHCEEIRKKEGWFDTIAYSVGVYGCNGKVVRGHNTGTYYVITCRSTSLWMF